MHVPVTDIIQDIDIVDLYKRSDDKDMPITLGKQNFTNYLRELSTQITSTRIQIVTSECACECFKFNNMLCFFHDFRNEHIYVVLPSFIRIVYLKNIIYIFKELFSREDPSIEEVKEVHTKALKCLKESEPNRGFHLLSLCEHIGRYEEYAQLMYDMAFCYTNGSGTHKDEKKAFEYLLKSSDLGYVELTFIIGKFYYEGKPGIKKNIKSATDYFTIASNKGYYAADFYLGLIYASKNTKIDMVIALKHYRKASDNNVPEAMCNLALLYIDGTCGIQKNIDKAIEYYKKAVELGSDEAQHSLGRLYYCIDDIKNAKICFEISAKNGNKMSADVLGDCPICYEAILVFKRAYITACKHIFHTNCIDEWIKSSNTCPICRSTEPLSLK